MRTFHFFKLKLKLKYTPTPPPPNNTVEKKSTLKKNRKMKAEKSRGKNESKKNQEEEEEEVRRGPWTLEEDTLLIHNVACHGEGRWNYLAKSAGLKRTGKSCRLRWLNYLKPDIKRGNLTPQEQLLILELHSKWGNRWSKIAAHLPGRTDNEIKNYWRTRVQKQAKQLNMESNSQGFINAIRCFYMPRLVQKIEQSSTDDITNNLNSQVSSASQMISSSINLEQINFDCDTKDNTSSSNTSHSISSISEIQDQHTNNVSKGSSVVPLYDCVNSCDYDDLDVGPISGSGIPFLGCHVEGSDWLGNDVALAGDGMWDLGELWQFRKEAKDVGI